MPNRWMDERERHWRDRQAAGREGRRTAPPRGGEGRSFASPGDDWVSSRWEEAGSDDRYANEPAYRPDPYGSDAARQAERQRARREEMYRWRRPDGGYETDRGRPQADPRDRPHWAMPEHSYFGFGYDVRGAQYGLNEEYSSEHHTPNVREGNGEHGRSWWDRTRDEVSAWFGDHDAERRRRWDAQTNHRGRGPKGYRRSDERINEDVHDRLTDDPWLDASGIEVTVAAGEVTLSGGVPDRHAKHRAEHVVEVVAGVSHVQNNLRIEDAYRGAAASSANASDPGKAG